MSRPIDTCERNRLESLSIDHGPRDYVHLARLFFSPFPQSFRRIFMDPDSKWLQDAFGQWYHLADDGKWYPYSQSSNAAAANQISTRSYSTSYQSDKVETGSWPGDDLDEEDESERRATRASGSSRDRADDTLDYVNSQCNTKTIFASKGRRGREKEMKHTIENILSPMDPGAGKDDDRKKRKRKKKQ